MKAVDIIIKKRDKLELTKDEIRFFVEGFSNGTIPDYQAAALAMAIQLNGMTDQETTDLTLAMAQSGEMLDLSDVVEISLDKHSTGGVGDKTTLVVEPLVAACGLPFGKMSGRGLGFTGGTLDKMESIPGYRTDLSRREFMNQLRDYGIVLTGQSGDLAPADGKLYGLRDVTGTVPAIPLIASSIMSKKIAGGANIMVLDVKVGVGAFMSNLEEARNLSKLMVSIAQLSGRKAVCMLSDMNQPLGCAVGNALELKEAIHTLQGEGPEDFVEHCLAAASYLVMLGGKADSLVQAREMVIMAWKDGSAFEKFKLLVKLQGGDVRYVEQLELLPKAEFVKTICAENSGYVKFIHARKIGEASVDLGAGRAKKTDQIDHSVGFEILQNVGNQINKGDPLFTVHANAQDTLEVAIRRVLDAFEFSAEPCDPFPLFYEIIE